MCSSACKASSLVVGRKNWLIVGSQQAGERAAVVMSLIESAKLNGHDPWAYLKDVFERLPTLKNRDLAQLLPHHWRPANDTAAATKAFAAIAAPRCFSLPLTPTGSRAAPGYRN